VAQKPLLKREFAMLYIKPYAKIIRKLDPNPTQKYFGCALLISCGSIGYDKQKPCIKHIS
jgi:hypothetical protein